MEFSNLFNKVNYFFVKEQYFNCKIRALQFTKSKGPEDTTIAVYNQPIGDESTYRQWAYLKKQPIFIKKVFYGTCICSIVV